MSHRSNPLLNLLAHAEPDWALLARYRSGQEQLTPEQLRNAASLGNGLGIQLDQLARQARDDGAITQAGMWHRAATALFDAASRDELAADLADHDPAEAAS